MTFNGKVSIFCNPCKCGNAKLKGIKGKEYFMRKWLKTFEIVCPKCNNNHFAYNSDIRSIKEWNKKNPGESRFAKEGIQVFK